MYINPKHLKTLPKAQKPIKNIAYNSRTCTKCGDNYKVADGSTCKCGFSTNYIDGLWLITREGKHHTHQPLQTQEVMKTNLK